MRGSASLDAEGLGLGAAPIYPVGPPWCKAPSGSGALHPVPCPLLPQHSAVCLCKRKLFRLELERNRIHHGNISAQSAFCDSF